MSNQDALYESECSGSIPWNLGAFDRVPRPAPEPPTDADVRVARDIGEEKACDDLASFSEFIYRAGVESGEREISAFFAYISTGDLISKVLLNPKATDKQMAEAAREIRRRYLEDEEDTVQGYVREVL